MIVLGATAPAAALQLSGGEIIGRMEQARDEGGADASSVLRLEIGSGDDALVRTVAIYRRRCGGEMRSLVVLRDPPDVSGTAVLTAARAGGRPDMWMYLPELGRVRQLNAFAQSERFMGSDLTYEDLGVMTIAGRDHRFLGEAELEGEPVYKVVSRPTPREETGRLLTWVNRATFLPVRIDTFDRVGAMVRTARFADVRDVRGIPTPFSIDLDNLESGRRTRLTLLEVDYFRDLDCNLFREERLAHLR